jgi:hypothetical protein
MKDRRDQLRGVGVPFKPKPMNEPLPPTPQAVPVYGDQSLVIYPAYVHPEQRAALAQSVVRFKPAFI